MSELAPRSNPRLANFEANKAKKEQDAFEAALYAGAGETDFSDEAHARIEEADAYERHLESMADGTHNGDLNWNRRWSETDRDLNNMPSAGYAAEVDAAHAEHAEREAEIEDRERTIEDTKELRYANQLAERIAALYNKPVGETVEADEEDIRHLEDRLNAVLMKYSETDGADPELIDLIIDRSRAAADHSAGSTPEAAKLGRAERVDTSLDDDDKEDDGDDEGGRTALHAARRVDTGLDDDDDAADRARLAGLTPVSTDLDDDEPEVRDGEEGRLTKDEALDEAYDEYEEAEGAPYDINKGRLNKDEALDAAYDEYERREGASYDDKGREKDREVAHDMALAEDQDRTMGTADEVLDEAYDEDERRNTRLSIWRNPGAYLGSLFTVRGGEALEKWRGSRRSTKIAIGVVAIAAAAGLAKLGYDFFNDPNVDPSNTPNGSGSDLPKPKPQDVDPGTLPAPKPESFSDAARTIDNGEGWLNQLKDMGFTDREAQNALEKILNSDDPGIKEWTYRMGDGNPGLSHPGTMPQSVLESIQKLKS